MNDRTLTRLASETRAAMSAFVEAMDDLEQQRDLTDDERETLLAVLKARLALHNFAEARRAKTAPA